MRNNKVATDANIDPRFEKWAKGFSGCDGGNLQGKIWLCGIEWGLGKAHTLEEEMQASVSRPPQVYERSEDVLRSPEGRPYPFNVLFLKLISVMHGGSIDEYKDIANETPFPFHKKSDYFKLNLFPVAFQKVDSALWDEQYRRTTGLATRREYIQWCEETRFPVIQSWVKGGHPKLIISVGLSNVEHFKNALGFRGPEHEEVIEDRRLVWMSKGATTLVVVPYATSPSGLNSNRVIKAFGERLSAMLGGELASGTPMHRRPEARDARPIPLTQSAKTGWNRTYSNPHSGAQTEYIERALSDAPRTAEEIAEIANVISGREDFVKPKRVTEHLTYHHLIMGAPERARRGRQSRMPQINHANGRWHLPVSMNPA